MRAVSADPMAQAFIDQLEATGLLGYRVKKGRGQRRNRRNRPPGRPMFFLSFHGLIKIPTTPLTTR